MPRSSVVVRSSVLPRFGAVPNHVHVETGSHNIHVDFCVSSLKQIAVSFLEILVRLRFSVFHCPVLV